MNATFYLNVILLQFCDNSYK